MRLPNSLRPGNTTARTTRFLREFGRNESGITALEFGLVAGPFFYLLFGIISVGLYFFILFSLEHAVETAARVIRTGQAQTQTPNPMTVAEFKALVCAKLPPFMPCTGSDKIRVNVKSYNQFDEITSLTTPVCLDSGGNLIPTGSQEFTPGTASNVVLVTVCYEWELTSSMANVPYWISPASGQMNNGSSLMQASTTFTTEPYN